MKSLTAQQAAEMVGGKLIGNPAVVVTGAASLEIAGPDRITFIGNKKYLPLLSGARAGVILADKELEPELTGEHTFIICSNVDAAFAVILAVFAPPPVTYVPGIHPSAIVDPSVTVGKNVYIGPNVVIEANSVIGDDTVIGAGTFIGQEVKIGRGNQIAPRVTIMHRCIIGNKNILHSGVVIGADGFGFVPGPEGIIKVPQTGIVQIDDDVEIGANTTIDRARFEKTWIKSNVKIDNQVMVAHNVEIGESSIIIAQAGIAGSAKLGRGVILAAKAGVNGHITLGDGVKVAATSAVAKSVPAGAIMVGTPAEEQRLFMTRLALPRKVQRLAGKFDELKKEVQQLKNQ
ncbi:MAG: UDP-3-O-(3-hydroxymyristoyl)glucosamine N-acyltransferase [Victivallaceae bacterium]|nr:UDP-3-O-(3-hydroxymyristoyl)glucosamine N-acyltransferase [Victivallaceae bacterium]